MSLSRVEALEALLSRVQTNRDKPRAFGPGSDGAQDGTQEPTTGVTKTVGAQPAMPPRLERERITIAEEHIHIPDRVSLPQQRPAMRSSTAGHAPSQPERGSRDATERSVVDSSMPLDARRRERSSTPLEMAVEGELNRKTPVELQVPPGVQGKPRAFSNTEPVMPAARPAVAHAPPQNLEMPLTFDPEPPREPARAIAQTVSKHAPEHDATFGAMLKRSLGLRPH